MLQNYIIHPDISDEFQKMTSAYREMQTGIIPIVKKTDDEILDFLNQSTEVCVTRHNIAGYDEFSPSITVYVFQPKEANKKTSSLPAILALHGGGYMTGTALMDGTQYCEEVLRFGCIIIAPEYRISTEAPYPAALNDCYATLRWIYQNASMLQIDRERICVYGNSAGGGLAAAVSILARDLREIPIAAQFLLSPMLDYRNETHSSYEFLTDEYVWYRDINESSWNLYLRDSSDSPISPYASPSILKDYQQLPPAAIVVGQADMFRDESIAYAVKLMQAGVPTELHVISGVPHGLNQLSEKSVVQRYHETVRTLLHNMLHRKLF